MGNGGIVTSLKSLKRDLSGCVLNSSECGLAAIIQERHKDGLGLGRRKTPALGDPLVGTEIVNILKDDGC